MGPSSGIYVQRSARKTLRNKFTDQSTNQLKTTRQYILCEVIHTAQQKVWDKCVGQ